MVAAPQYGVATFLGLSTNRSYSKDIYCSDVANAFVNWDGGTGASATSPTDWIPPESVRLIDFAIVTGMTDTTKVQIVRGASVTGDHLRFGMHLVTLTKRGIVNLDFPAGQKIQLIQKA